jgi:hypothetical protein
MNEESITTFVHQIMDINATFPGVGTASSGVFGTIATGDQTVYQLKKTVVAFASEYSKSSFDVKLVRKLAKEIDGYLMTLQIVSVITNDRYRELSTDLGKLMGELMTS